MTAAGVQWEQLTDVERTCLGVAYARWHASSKGSMPCHWPDGRPWYSDPLGALFVAGIPPAEQQRQAEVRLKGDSWMRLFCAVRTTEIDAQIQSALQQGSQPAIQQMVLLGAGMDTRAWRLQWPAGFSVFEVDSQQVLDFKHRILQGGSSSGTNDASSQQHPLPPQQQEGGANGLPALSCQRRGAVAADASKPEEMWSHLLSAGLSASTPTVYVLEGFIGYLDKEAGNALLQLLATRSAPGSRIIMTAPPTPTENRVGHDAAIAAAVAAANAAAATDGAPSAAADAGGNTAAPAAGTADSSGGAAPAPAAAPAAAAEEGAGGGGGWSVDVSGVRVYRPKLHHSTFEEPTETLARLSAAGWSDCQLLTAEELGAKYGVPKAQPILLGRVV